ncbi:MAG: DUF4493 domain-containing protein [Muribaculaceae bacterium]|nr:DUF4493 domain-containing protein [Muribaculaceae bacterium]
MKLNKYYLYGILALGLASCANEAPFADNTNFGEGSFSKYSISLDVKGEDNIKITSTRASTELDFDIIFIPLDNSEEKRYKYSQMPDIVPLKEGSYVIEAKYGDESLDAAWDNPHFSGKSQEFVITRDKINTELDPITCTLQNVMVSVVFDDDLVNNHMDGDPKVEVYVNKDQPLVFGKNHSDNKIPGYFKHSEVCTLTAEFSGVVDGVELKEIKTLDNVEPGNHYRLNFARHSFNGEDFGQVSGTIVIDANVYIQNLEDNIDQPEEKVLTDVTWPTEEPEDGQKPGDGDGDKEPEPGPEQPGDGDSDEILDGLHVFDNDSDAKLGEPYKVNDKSKIALTFTSKPGFQEFNVVVESTGGLTELIGEGSDQGKGDGKLDLVHPGNLKEFLQKVNLLEGDSVEGLHKVVFDVTDLMSLLLMVDGTHTFNIHVKDESGELNEKLILIVEK